MEGQRGGSSPATNSKLTCITSRKNASAIVSMPKTIIQESLNRRGSRGHMIGGIGGDVAIFLLKVAALETTRRLSRAKCPFAWRTLQACQMLCYPPFKWVQRWAPLKSLVQGMQMLSRPLLVLSIATAFYEKSEKTDASDDRNVSDACTDLDKESSSAQPCVDARDYDEFSTCPSPENWLLKLYEELEKQRISLPERINENELRRFYKAADGNFSCLLSSIKKTIRWRETYNILSEQELKVWSNAVFWHGYDTRDRPCLIVRVGLACTSLPNHDRPRFAQAVVSQMEHGILHLANPENPQIMVLVDCEGLSPFRIPMQMLRSCSLLFQDHFPNCLGGLFVIRLPPVVRVMAQTLMKVLKPVTRQKLRFIGDKYKEVLSQYFDELPACLGGKCICATCSSGSSYNTHHLASIEVANDPQLTADGFIYEDTAFRSLRSEIDMYPNVDQVLRTGMIGILMFCVLIAFLAGMYDPESRPNMFP